MPNQIRRVGVVGSGAMGMGVAQSLLRVGFEVHACDVRPEAVSKIIEAGAHGADTPAALGPLVDPLIIVVVTAQQTDAVLFGDQGAAATMTPGSIVIASATVSPEFAQQLGDRLEGMGLELIDAPISGRRQPKRPQARCPAWWAPAGRKLSRREKICSMQLLLGFIGLGDKPGAGSTVKMINQLLAGVHIAAAAKAMALGIRAGAVPRRSTKSFATAQAAPGCFKTGPRTYSLGTIHPLSAVNIFVKDLGIVLDYAGRVFFHYLCLPLLIRCSCRPPPLATEARTMLRSSRSFLE